MTTDLDVQSRLMDFLTPVGGVMIYKRRMFVGHYALTLRDDEFGIGCTLAISEAGVWYSKWSAIEVMLGLQVKDQRICKLREHLTQHLMYVPVYRYPLSWRSFSYPRVSSLVPRVNWSEAETIRWVKSYLPPEVVEVWQSDEILRAGGCPTDVFLPIQMS